MKYALLAIGLWLVVSPAMAQFAPPTPLEQALGLKLNDEVNANIRLQTQIIQLQNQLKSLQSKLNPKIVIPDVPSPAER